LINAGEDLICLDNFFTGRLDNVAHLLDNPRFQLVRHDVIYPIQLEVGQITTWHALLRRCTTSSIR
jgi:UDP-glucuronate decarboxylase